MFYIINLNFKFFLFNQIAFRFIICTALIKSKEQNINSKLSEITLTIKEKGNNIKISSNTTYCGATSNIRFSDFPNRVIINNIIQNFTGIFVNLTEEINIV